MLVKNINSAYFLSNMGNCELCGKEGNLKKVSIEGVDMEACMGCAKFGKPIAPPKQFMPRERPRHFKRPQGPEYRIVDDFSKLLRTKREKMGLTQEQIARMVAERESIIQKMESGNFKPSITMARKLGKILNITFVEERKEDEKIELKQTAGGVTIGDLIKKR